MIYEVKRTMTVLKIMAIQAGIKKWMMMGKVYKAIVLAISKVTRYRCRLEVMADSLLPIFLS